MPTLPDEVGPVYSAGLVSPGFGSLGVFIKEGTFRKDLQTQLRDEVVGALSIAIADRDLEFWKRQSQNDWSQGEGQEYFSNASRYSKASSLDVHLPGTLRLVPQPTQLKAAAGSALNGRGAVLCKQKAFFPWTDGNYAWADNTLTVSTATTPVGARIGDIASDGTNVFFSLMNGVNIYTTTGAAPGALAAYDASGSNWGRIVYDQLNKILYAVSSPLTGLAAFKKINAGGAATAIYDFVTGRLDALEMHLGSVILGWNDGQGAIDGTTPTVGSLWRAKLFKYDGTNMTNFADLPEGAMVIGLKSALGLLFVLVEEADPLDAQNSPPAWVFGSYVVSGSTLTRLGTITGNNASEPASSLVYIGSHSMAAAVAEDLFFPGSGFSWRYDTALGGLSRSLGDDSLPGLVNTFSAATMSSIVFMPGAGMLCEYGGGNSTGGIYNLNGTVNGITPSFPSQGTGKLTSSRIDGGLPYVPKFWYDIQCIFTGLMAGESVQMEYSLDDGTTWVTCSNSPFSTVLGTQANFTVQQSNPHIRYRVRPVAAAATKGPTIFSVSCRYAVTNPNASVYRFTAECDDDMRARNNLAIENYGKDALAYFDNIARENKVVTFYEPNDSTRTAHSCWVMSMGRPMPNTSGAYNPNKAEGDVEIVLWETTG